LPSAYPRPPGQKSRSTCFQWTWKPLSHQRRTEKTGLCRQATTLKRDADLCAPRAGQSALQAAYHSLDQDVPREKGDARLVQIEGFDPEEVATLNVETCLEKLGLKNGPPVIPRSWRDVEPNHHSPILRAVTENAVTTLTLAGNVCTWHNSDMPPWSLYVRCWGQSGKHMLLLSFSAFDPGCVKT